MTERILVRDLMTVGVMTCAPESPIADVASLLLERDLEGVVVLDEDGHAVGIVSRDELVAAYERATRDEEETLTAQEVMRDGVPEIPADIPLTAAAQLMQDRGERVVFLMHHAGGIAYPAGVLSTKHFLRHLSARSDDDLSDLGTAAARQPPLETYTEKRDAARHRAGATTQE